MPTKLAYHAALQDLAPDFGSQIPAQRHKIRTQPMAFTER